MPPTTQLPPAVDALVNDAAFRQPWYYSIELAPGVFTEGMEFENVVLTRALLARCQVEDQDCLDIGAMDGLLSTLLTRRGARRVIAYDRASFPERIALLKRTLGVDFEYVSGLPLSELRPVVRALGIHPFDVTIFSGVLYHVFDPLGMLLRARSMVRSGGILIVETAAILDDGMAMHFNANGQYYPSANYWKPSLACLDYLLRLARLQPIDCVFHRHERRDDQLGRVAVTCRAVDVAVAEPEDGWMSRTVGTEHEIDFAEYIDWDELGAGGRPAVDYTPDTSAIVLRSTTNTVDLAATAAAMPETRMTDRLSQIALTLDACV